jgi:hypothetical protein
LTHSSTIAPLIDLIERIGQSSDPTILKNCLPYFKSLPKRVLIKYWAIAILKTYDGVTPSFFAELFRQSFNRLCII